MKYVQSLLLSFSGVSNFLKLQLFMSRVMALPITTVSLAVYSVYISIYTYT